MALHIHCLPSNPQADCQSASIPVHLEHGEVKGVLRAG
jgi:hypothetical protein